MVKLGEFADLDLGKMLDQKKNKGIPRKYLANVDVRWGAFNLANLKEMRFQDSELERYGLKFGDIVMCEGGEPGRCAIWKEQIPGMMYQKALHRIRPHKELDFRFLYYWFLLLGRNASLRSFPERQRRGDETDFATACCKIQSRTGRPFADGATTPRNPGNECALHSNAKNARERDAKGQKASWRPLPPPPLRPLRSWQGKEPGT